jgi:hypothetical protein
VTPREPRLVGVALAVLLCAGCASDGADGRAEAGSSLAVGMLQPRSVARTEGGDLLEASAGPTLGTVLAPVSLIDQRSAGGGTGSARVTLVPARNELCVAIEVAGIDQPTAAHLHEVPSRGDGEVVLALKAPGSGDAAVDTCVSASAGVLQRIGRTPDRFEIAVTTEAVPEGALRGQLR